MSEKYLTSDKVEAFESEFVFSEDKDFSSDSDGDFEPYNKILKQTISTKLLTQYFVTTKNEESIDNENEDESDEEENINNFNGTVSINDNVNLFDINSVSYISLEEIFNDNNKLNFNDKNYVERFEKLENILQYQYKLGKMQASICVTEEIYSKGSYQAMLIRK
ncbi:18461_t:CDS:2 [Funneliformis geosporum]|uniref:18461_t:CDS:1 n=1 Tax=Funneliformis geosporum TaxID=1117311 RepID=A0A9W4X4Q9_9GLOM|nr:18461_t:CDS:2 [Funneliformis geosporum]